ncbi:MAG: hypothetical protein AAGA56_05945, partial [Myxococcota bacterium]
MVPVRHIPLSLVLLTLGCGERAPDEAPSAVGSASAAAVSVPASQTGQPSGGPSPVTEEERQAWRACQVDIDATKAKPALPGAPTFEENRVHMARVRGHSLLWRRAPQPNEDLDTILAKNDTSVKVVRAFRRKFRRTKNKDKRRALALREGYLFHEDVKMALAIVEQVSLPKLFREKKVFIQRGLDIYEATFEKRTKLHHDRFVYRNGPFDGEKAELLLGDRVALDRQTLEKEAPLFIDLGELMGRSNFDRLRPVHLAEDQMVADVRYGPNHWAPALFSLNGAKAELTCEVLTGPLAATKKDFIKDSELRRVAVGRLRKTVRQMVRDHIPFDADDGQTMGFLRKAWKRAYFKGWRKFNYEDELRTVYGSNNNAVPPQVCIDFLTDTWERASGTWYAPKPEGRKAKPTPARTEGGIDFDKVGVENRRSVAE